MEQAVRREVVVPERTDRPWQKLFDEIFGEEAAVFDCLVEKWQDSSRNGAPPGTPQYETWREMICSVLPTMGLASKKAGRSLEELPTSLDKEKHKETWETFLENFTENASAKAKKFAEDNRFHPLQRVLVLVFDQLSTATQALIDLQPRYSIIDFLASVWTGLMSQSDFTFSNRCRVGDFKIVSHVGAVPDERNRAAQRGAENLLDIFLFRQGSPDDKIVEISFWTGPSDAWPRDSYTMPNGDRYLRVQAPFESFAETKERLETSHSTFFHWNDPIDGRARVWLETEVEPPGEAER